MASIAKAIEKIECNQVDPMKMHKRVQSMYSWSDVAQRTEKVYLRVLKNQNSTLLEQFVKYNGCGLVAGKLSILIIALNYLLYLFLETVFPREDMDECVDFDFKCIQALVKKQDTVCIP